MIKYSIHMNPSNIKSTVEYSDFREEELAKAIAEVERTGTNTVIAVKKLLGMILCRVTRDDNLRLWAAQELGIQEVMVYFV